MVSGGFLQFNTSMDKEDSSDSSISWTNLIVALKAIVYVAGFLGNIFVILVITNLKEYRKTAHWYLLQLSMADFVFLNTIPFKIMETMQGSWDFSPQSCKAMNAILYLNYYASILLLTVMAVDRYTAVCHPLSPRVQVFRTPAFCYWTSAAIWLVSLGLCIPVILYSDKVGIHQECACRIQFPINMKEWCLKNHYSDEELCQKELELPEKNICFKTSDGLNLTDITSIHFLDLPTSYGNETTDEDFSMRIPNDGELDYDPKCAASDPLRPGFHMFVYFNFSAMFVFPLLVVSICYGFIVFQVAKRKEIHADKYSSVHGQHRKVVKESKRVTMVCALLVVFFAICWLPFHSYYLVKLRGIPSSDGSVCNQLAVAVSILAYVNSAMNPFIYNFFGKNFRARIRQIRLRRGKGRGRRLTASAPTNSSATTSIGTRYKSARI